jgi:hypothetical protein
MGRFLDRALVGLAIASRLAAVLVLQSYQVPHSTYEHGEIAANLLEGRGFAIHFLGADGLTSQQAPVYPATVALAYWVGGDGTPQALLLLQASQGALGGVLVLGVLRLARLIAPSRPGLAWIAGLVVALHPTLIYAATHVQVASLATTLLVWTLALAYQTAATGRDRDAVITGSLLALLVLADPILALAGTGVASVMFAHSASTLRTLRGSLRLITVILLTALAGISPWQVRNLMVHGEWVAIKSTFGYAFWQGNCALSQGTDKVVRPSVERVLARDDGSRNLAGLNRTLWEARHEAGYIDDIALSKDDYRRLGSVSEPERSRILFRRALAELSADRSRYARLCLRRLGYFIFFDETNPKSRLLAYRVPHAGLTLFGGLGLLLAGTALRKRLLPTIVTAAAIAIFHSATIVSARFHLPIEPLLALWGAAGLVHCLDQVTSRPPGPLAINRGSTPRRTSPGRTLVWYQQAAESSCSRAELANAYEQEPGCCRMPGR